MTKTGFVRRRILTLASVLLLLPARSLVAQEPAPPPAQALSPDQLDNLVAPVALYPDRLLSQVLVAATYPLEVVEAAQWLQQNPGLQGQALVDAAQQQNWDPSVQALVAFPDVLNRLNSDIRWTTDLGNAFLAQQADVMNAVQRMRARARASGRLRSTPQETVTTETQGGQTVIEIQPANPEVVYVPVYNPEYIWGPPVYGYYPPLYYPDFAFGFGFGPAIYLGGFWGGLGWGGWGWGPNWFGCSIFLNPFFFNHYGYHGYWGGHGGFYGRGGYGGGGRIWMHDPGHRMGVPYSNSQVANRFHGVAGSGGAVARGSLGGQRYTGQGSSPMRQGSVSGFRGSAGTGVGPRGPNASGGQAGGWRRFGESGSGQSFHSSAPLSGNQGPSRSNGGYSRPYNSSPAAPGYRPSYGGGYSRGGSAPAYRPSPSYAYRPSPSYGGGYGAYSGGRSMPSYRSSPSYGGGSGYRSAPSYSGHSYGGGGYHGGGGSYHSSSGGGGGGFHSSGGGGSSHGGGGGGGGGHHR